MAKIKKGSKLAHTHDLPIHVMNIGKAHVFGGPERLMDSYRWDLRITLEDAGFIGYQGTTTAPAVSGNAAAQALLPKELFEVANYPALVLDWSDYGAPPLDRPWWDTLIAAIRKLPKGSKVGVNCYGGHGRTGTALTILGCLSGNVPDGKDPVEWVREKYCYRAVESDRQLDYIEEITGLLVTSEAANDLRPLMAPQSPSPLKFKMNAAGDLVFAGVGDEEEEATASSTTTVTVEP